MPSYVSVMIVVAIVIYTGINFLATPPPTSLKLIFGTNFLYMNSDSLLCMKYDDRFQISKLYTFLLLCTCADEYSEDILSGIPLTEDGEPLPEIGTDQVNQLFNDLYS